ncbi:MAG: aryl-sulfate sulfotransferase [Euryarchaeota archaeon]|nr:aryl-sulfate sulfotransferase [Euryarchaeota archaeon]
MKRKAILSLLNVQLCKKFFTAAIISIVFLSLGTFFVPSLAQTVEQKVQQNTTTFDGQILFAPMDSKITYLIDSTGVVNHTWSSSYLPGVGVRWLGDGTILRTIRVGVGPGTGGAGGGVQKIEWDGTVVWDFRYNTNGHLSHHDVISLPNGNVLLIAWETKTSAEAIAAGRNPNYVSSNGLYPDHIIEVQPTGSTSGTIVWEWHVWDHLIQDYDSSKANYGVVGDHPELVDINYKTSSESDWMHTNSVDYKEEFDQILISVCYFDEIWIIDHSTTTAEAAGHTGGNNGKGGDLLYRWGNPAAYRAGTTLAQKLFNQHDASWIDEGCPGEGNILVFNNGMGRSGSRYSSVDEIVPPVDENGEYYLKPGSAYGPTAQTWIYTGSPPTSFYSSHLSGAERLTDGSTLICNGEPGVFFEITSTNTTVWTYKNPYPAGAANNVFKIVYIPQEAEQPESNASDLDCSGSLSWTDIEPGETVTGSFQVQNVGNITSLLNWTIDISSVPWGTWSYTPESGENLSPGDRQVTVQVSVVAPDEKNSDFAGYIRVENKDNPDDFEWIPISLTTPVSTKPVQWTMLNQFLLHFLQRHLFIEKLWNLFSPWYEPLSD